MRSIRLLSALGTILFLSMATAGLVFAQGHGYGGSGMGGSHYRTGGGLGLVNPTSSFGYVGGYGGGGFGGGGWGAWFPGYPNDPYGYATGRIPTPPYFALHPPVYYGKRVGMPYGNSPVTRPPRAVVDYHTGVQQVVVHVQQPAMILNPYAGEVSETAESSPSPETTEVVQDATVTADRPAVDKQRRQKTGNAKQSRGSSRSKRKTRKSAE